MSKFYLGSLNRRPPITETLVQRGVRGWKIVGQIGKNPVYQGIDIKGNRIPGLIHGSGFPASEVQGYKNILTQILPPGSIEGLKGEALVITLNRPKENNFLNLETMQEINSALEGTTDKTQVVIFNGEGRHFCAGVSIEEHLPPHYENTIKAFTELIEKISEIKIPTVGLIQGSVRGGGAELITVLDYVIAAEDVRIGFPETTLNVIPYIALVTLPRIVDNPKWAFDAILDGGLSFSARGALGRRLVNEVVPQKELNFSLVSKYLDKGKGEKSRLLNFTYAYNSSIEREGLKQHGNKIIDRVIKSNPKISKEVLGLTLRSLLELGASSQNLRSNLDKAQIIYLLILMKNLREPAIRGLEGYIKKEEQKIVLSKALKGEVKVIDKPLPLDRERVARVNARIEEIQNSPRPHTEIGKMWAIMFNPRTLALELKQVPIPKLRAGEVLVKIIACGGCGTDAHYIDGSARPIIQDRELILGHEASGKVVLLGPGVEDRDLLNKNVLIPAVLKNGWMVGSDINGAWAEFMAFPADQLVLLPKNFPLVKGCVVADAITTPYHAVVSRAQLKADEVAGVIGVGGVGMNVIQVVRARQGIPVAMDINPHKLDLASRLGAKLTINTSKLSEMKVKPHEAARVLGREIEKALGRPISVVFEAIGDPSTIDLAYNLSLQGKRGQGRAIIIGYGEGTMNLRTEDIMYKEAELRGSYGCPIEEYPEAIDLVTPPAPQVSVDGIVTHAYGLWEYKRWIEDTHKDPTISRGIFVMPEAYPNWWNEYVDSAF